MTDLRKVEPLYKTQSRHDVMYKGKKLLFSMEGCGDGGVVLTYTFEKEIPKDMPDFIQDYLKQSSVLMQCHVHLRWWEKLLRIPLKWRVKREIAKMKNVVTRGIQSASVVERMREEFENE